ncbi:MAG: hypothetical protein O2894_04100 [Planctomycetota bacterium]|nr:hypothetical protein [Planctomycetota bacterium]
MSLDDLISAAWAEHGDAAAAVSARLEGGVELVADADGAGRFMHIVNHVIGDHLGERTKAARLCEAAVKRAGADAGPGAYVHLAVARVLAGDDAGAEAAIARLGDDEAQRIRVGALVAQGHANAGTWDDASQIYTEQLAAAAALPTGHAAERSLAVVSNNIANEALECAQRTPAITTLMEQAAETARMYWLRVGTWVNDERADYLLALVRTAAGKPDEALMHAGRALATIANADGEEPVDEAFLHLARAAALRDLGRTEDHASALAAADALRATMDAGLHAWFDGQRAKSV